VVFSHELGHFFASKLVGVKVERFSFGLGPKLIGFTLGETQYLLSAIPFGGYVKLAGEEQWSARGAPHEFFSKPPLTRGKIILAGPAFNLISAFLIFWIVFTLGVPSNRIDVMKQTPAWEAGLLPGDRIIEIGDEKIPTWGKLMRVISESAGERKEFKILRGKVELLREIKIEADKEYNVGYIRGILPYFTTEIGEIKKGYPAQKCGLRRGDIVKSINGVKMKNWREIAKLIHQNPGKKLKICVKRGDKEIEFSVTPRLEKLGDREVGLIGVVPKRDIERFSPLNSLWLAMQQAISLIQEVFIVLGRLLTGGVSLRTLAGPLGIAHMAGEVARVGFSTLLSFIAFVSINLCILNLLPIPLLDGGHLVFLGIERLRGKVLSQRTQEIAQRIGAGILISLIILVTFNDIMRILKIVFR
jgi:regulator of sigma E protease